MEHSGNIPRTISEYSGNMSWECSTNIPRTYICQAGKTRRKFLGKVSQEIQNEKYLINECESNMLLGTQVILPI